MTKRLLIGLLSGALALILVVPGAAVAKKDRPQDACKSGGWADLLDADGQPFATQGACAGYIAGPGGNGGGGFLLAIAYSNLNGQDGFQPGSADVLIARLLDTDGDGLDAGDRIEMGKAVTSLTPTFVDFLAGPFTVDEVIPTTGAHKHVRVDGVGRFAWSIEDGQSRRFDGFATYGIDGGNPYVEAWDSHHPSADYVVVKKGAPGKPDVTDYEGETVEEIDGSDDIFLDVRIP